MKGIRNKPCWIFGIATAMTGVWISRIGIHEVSDSHRISVLFLGYALALGGLVILTFGTRVPKDQD